MGGRSSAVGNLGAARKRALVTGHLGYVGVVLTPILQSEGWDVTGLDIALYDSCDYGGVPQNVPALSKDIRDVTAEDLAGFQVVFRLVMDEQFIALECAFQFALGNEAFD